MAGITARKTLPESAFTRKGRATRAGGTLLERIASQWRETPTGCHQWTGGSRGGYGILYVYHTNSDWNVTHLVWIHAKRELPKGHLLRHTCDNPGCINLQHLLLGVDVDNKKDSIDRERHSFGETHGPAKLTEAQVISLRADARTTAAIALTYGISDTEVSAIQLGQKWTHLPGARNPRGRRPFRGETHGGSPLTADDVRAIRKSPPENRRLARQYGVSTSTIWQIRSRRKWVHIPD
jgi:hypothetical protein